MKANLRISARIGLCWCVVSSTASWASNPATPITVNIDTTSRSYAIPSDFVGLSFETASALPNRYGVSGYFFSPANTQVATLLQNIGMKNLRIGGGTGDTGGRGGFCVSPINPTRADIDNLFEFARVAGMKVTYSLRLLNPSACLNPQLASEDAATAQYIWNHFRSNLQSFSIGNEPDWHAYHTYPEHTADLAIYETLLGTPGSAYPSYIADWRKFADAVLSAVPGATFSGPDTGAYSKLTFTPDPSSGVSWTQQFARDEKSSGVIKDATQHHYVGGGPGDTTAQQAIDNMLSAAWVNDTSIRTQLAGTNSTTTYTPYPWLYDNILAPVLSLGLPYRMTEANDYLRGVPGASDVFAAALWALDYMHWWAAHGAAGVNFHNNPWLLTDTIVPNPRSCAASGCGDYYVTPKGYGMKAFDLGGHGYVEPVTVSNPNGINLTAYAVGDAQNLYVTIINKTHSSTHDSTDAKTTILPNGFGAAQGTYMVLTDSVPGDPSLPAATLGGAPITNNARWMGQWTPLNSNKNGTFTLTVQATTAVVVRIQSTGHMRGRSINVQQFWSQAAVRRAFVRATTIMAALFMLTSLALAIMADRVTRGRRI
jgi:preprotein translocase subunit SecG